MDDVEEERKCRRWWCQVSVRFYCPKTVQRFTWNYTGVPDLVALKSNVPLPRLRAVLGVLVALSPALAALLGSGSWKHFLRLIERLTQ